METPHSILKKFFGYDSFRPGQEQIVQRLLAGQDVLAEVNKMHKDEKAKGSK